MATLLDGLEEDFAVGDSEILTTQTDNNAFRGNRTNPNGHAGRNIASNQLPSGVDGGWGCVPEPCQLIGGDTSSRT